MVCWALISPVMIVERRFGIAALRRSRELVRGAWGRTFAILFIAGLIASVPGGMLKVYWMFIPYLGEILNAATSAVVSTYSAVVLVIYYFDRRCRVEEFDLHFLARQIRAEGEAGTAAAASRDFDHCLIFPIPRSISLPPRFSRARSTARRQEGIRYSCAC